MILKIAVIWFQLYYLQMTLTYFIVILVLKLLIQLSRRDLIYGNLIWGNAYKSSIEKIMKIRKKIVRLMTFKSYFEHTEPIFQELQILNIYKVNDYLTSLFMISYFH